MKGELLYLRQNIMVEPLVDRWYAWTALIPPATLARNITERHMKIMDSYISAPQIHANAVKNPKMLGGPFIDYQAKRVDEIRELRDRTKRERKVMFELSSAITDLEGLLRTTANGYSLTPLYKAIPEPLRGYVELGYDLSNRPNFRIIEPLLYQSKYYNSSSQSLMLSIITGDDRPFVLSTPRLDEPGSIHLSIPFSDERLDELFSLKHSPQPFEAVRALLDVPEDKADLLASFLTTDPPPGPSPFQGEGVRWRYFGHACILIESNGISMLFDPVLSYSYESSVSRYTYQDLPESIDYVLITHNHQDHVLFETLLQLRRRIKHLVVPRNNSGSLQDPSLKLLLSQVGFKNVIELDEMESIPLAKGFIRALPFFGEHADLAIRSKQAYLVSLDGNSLLFAADSCNVEPRLYEHLHKEIGDIDALFLGMECDGAPLTWLYGPLLTQRVERSLDESRRLNGSDSDQAMQIVEQFRCRNVYIYAMGQEPWLNYVMSLKYTDQSRPIVESNRVISECMKQGIEGERLFGKKEVWLPKKGASVRAGSL
jgi:L-ascorbate metabolism protein UlaG (beta-lactamase superfamily)